MQYLIGYIHGQEYVGFKDVKNVQYDETEDYDLILKFEDENDSYEYIKNGEYYVEVEGKAPKFMTYEIVDDVDFNSRQYDLPQEEEDNRPLRSYEFLVCNGEGAASRGLDYDTYNGSYIYQAHDLEEAYKYLTSKYFDMDTNELDEILDVYDSFKEYWDNQDITGGDPYVIAYRDNGNEVWLFNKDDVFDSEYCKELDENSREELRYWLPNEYLDFEYDEDDFDELDEDEIDLDESYISTLYNELVDSEPVIAEDLVSVKRDEKGRFKGIRPTYDKDENISDYDRIQLKAYNILKSKRPYAVIYAYDQGNGKVLLNPPLEKRSQEEVQDFVDSFKTGNQAVRVVVDVFNLTELKKIEYSLRRRNLIQ